jgi:polyhydroxyalkanoate synthesis repressor PhaR
MSQRIIKRYSNRKLYDTKDSRYVTLLQIAEMVRAGEDVQIIDNNTKDDLTEVTLAQIIFEEQKANQKSLPLQTLKDLIHQRTEKALSSLREGPIGRLIPGGSTEEEAVEPEPAAAASKPTLMDQAKGTIEDFQHRIDDRVRTLLPTLLPWHELETKVRTLSQRVEELEKQLAERGNGGK